MWQKINFKEIDAGMTFNYPDDLYELIKTLKFTYVSEYVYTNYYLFKKSIAQISNDLGFTAEACAYWMKKWNFPRRSPGGANFKGRKI